MPGVAAHEAAYEAFFLSVGDFLLLADRHRHEGRYLSPGTELCDGRNLGIARDALHLSRALRFLSSDK